MRKAAVAEKEAKEKLAKEAAAARAKAEEEAKKLARAPKSHPTDSLPGMHLHCIALYPSLALD